MGTTPSSTVPPEIQLHGTLRSEAESEAANKIFSNLRSGPIVLRLVLRRLKAKGINVQKLYLEEIEIWQEILMENFQPPLNFPTWDEVNPTSKPATTNPETSATPPAPKRQRVSPNRRRFFLVLKNVTTFVTRPGWNGKERTGMYGLNGTRQDLDIAN